MAMVALDTGMLVEMAFASAPVRAEMCSRFEPQHVAEHQIQIAEHLALTQVQQEALKDVLAALQSSLTNAQTLCLNLSKPETTPAAMQLADETLQLALQAVQDVRPSLDVFYASLNETQQQRLDAWMDHSHHRHGRQEHSWFHSTE